VERQRQPAFHIYNQYVVRSAQRDKLQAHLKAAGIGTEIYYPVPLHLQGMLCEFGVPAGRLPGSGSAARERWRCRIYPELTHEQFGTRCDESPGFLLNQPRFCSTSISLT